MHNSSTSFTVMYSAAVFDPAVPGEVGKKTFSVFKGFPRKHAGNESRSKYALYRAIRVPFIRIK